MGKKKIKNTMSLFEAFLNAPVKGVVCDYGALPEMDSFDAPSYMGTWYGIARSTNMPFQPDAWTCTTAQYSELDEETGIFKVHNTSQSRWGGPRFGIKGHVTCPAEENVANQCVVNFWPWKTYTRGNYYVLETDYTSYSMVYNCETDDMAYLWILSRSPTMDADLLSQLEAKAATYLPNYDFDNLVYDRQDDICRYNDDALDISYSISLI